MNERNGDEVAGSCPSIATFSPTQKRHGIPWSRGCGRRCGRPSPEIRTPATARLSLSESGPWLHGGVVSRHAGSEALVPRLVTLRSVTVEELRSTFVDVPPFSCVGPCVCLITACQAPAVTCRTEHSAHGPQNSPYGLQLGRWSNGGDFCGRMDGATLVSLFRGFSCGHTGVR